MPDLDYEWEIHPAALSLHTAELRGRNVKSNQPEWLSSKNPQTINAGEGMERRGFSHTVGRNVNWYSHYGAQYCFLVDKSCLFCNLMDSSLPGFPVHGVSQARILHWQGVPFTTEPPDGKLKKKKKTTLKKDLPCDVLSSSVVADSLQPLDRSPPGSSVHGILQARMLEWVAVPSSRGSSRPRDQTHIPSISCIAVRFFTHWATWEAQRDHMTLQSHSWAYI